MRPGTRGTDANQVFDEIPQKTPACTRCKWCFTGHRDPAGPCPSSHLSFLIDASLPSQVSLLLPFWDYHRSEEFTPLFVQLVKSQWSCIYKLGSTVVDSGKKRKYSTHALLDQSSDSDSGTDRNSAEIGSTCFDGPNRYVAPGESYPFLQASSLQHWFKNWQERRRCKLTASTFALAIGFWPNRRVQLWLEKIGAREPFTGSLATCWNNIKEEEALERYKLITGNSLLFTEFQVYGESNPDDEWLAASPDGVVAHSVYNLPSRGMLEVKCPFFNGEMKATSPWKRIPHYYIPQAQGLMEILDKEWMDFYCWTPNGSSLFRIYRDPEYWDILKMALSDFWWKHVHPAREIYRRYEISEPLQQLSSFVPAPRHELLPHIVIKSKHIVDDSPLLVREIHGKLQD